MIQLAGWYGVDVATCTYIYSYDQLRHPMLDRRLDAGIFVPIFQQGYVVYSYGCYRGCR